VYRRRADFKFEIRERVTADESGHILFLKEYHNVGTLENPRQLSTADGNGKIEIASIELGTVNRNNPRGLGIYCGIASLTWTR